MKKHGGNLNFSEWSQTKKVPCCIIPTIWPFGKGKTIVTKKISGWQGVEGERGVSGKSTD